MNPSTENTARLAARELLAPNPKLRLREQVREVMRFKHYSVRTEQAYWNWIRQFLAWARDGGTSKFKVQNGKGEGRPHPGPLPREREKHRPRPVEGEEEFRSEISDLKGEWRHPREMGMPEVHAFLTHLATEKNVAVATQNQALNALVFLYGQVLHQPLGQLEEYARPSRPARVPVVLTQEEARRLLAAVPEKYALLARLLYGTGLRVMEGTRLRVKDVDFGAGHIVARDGKGFKDRVTMLPESLREPLRAQLERARVWHAKDLAEGCGRVHLPYALARKYPNAEREWCWQYVFPAEKRSIDRKSVNPLTPALSPDGGEEADHGSAGASPYQALRRPGIGL